MLVCIQEVTELESCHTATQLPTAAGRVSHSGDLSRTLSELLLVFHTIYTVFLLKFDAK